MTMSDERHFIDDPLRVTSVVPDFSGMGIEPESGGKQKAQQWIGEQVAALRKQQGMTQEELARRCGLKQNHITRIENGCYNVGIHQVYIIAEALGYELTFRKK